MARALQDAQQSLQNAGQQSPGGGGESSPSEMGQEMAAGAEGKQGVPLPGEGGGKGQGGSGSGPGMGGPGRGAGGSAGPQQPLPGAKQGSLVRGARNPNGRQLSRGFTGTPDPSRDRAAYYSVVPEKVRAAEATLNREEIPTGYRKQVRDYFEAIQPR